MVVWESHSGFHFIIFGSKHDKIGIDRETLT